MKKLFLAIICIAAFSFSGQAQESLSANALGLRFGGGNGYGGELSYQRLLTENNRLELDLGFRSKNDFNSFKLTGLYQWVWNIQDGFYWYAGVGAGIGSVNDRRHGEHHHSDGAFALVAGNIGIEYDFNVPLQLFIDFRPEIILASYDVYDNFGPDFALGIRYRW